MPTEGIVVVMPPDLQEEDQVTDHRYLQVVLCQSVDEPEDIIVYGPFDNIGWAYGWIKQHDHDPYEDEEGNEYSDDVQNQYLEDEDHYCNLSGGVSHQVVGMWVPAFDSTTGPVTPS